MPRAWRQNSLSRFHSVLLVDVSIYGENVVDEEANRLNRVHDI